MRTTFSPDHACPQCQCAVYWWVGTRGETRCMEVQRCRPHMCAVAEQQAAISNSRCPDCGLSTYTYQDALYDEDAALVRHLCERASPQPAAVRPVPTATTPTRRAPLWEAYDA